MLKLDYENLRRYLLMALIVLAVLLAGVIFYYYYPAILGAVFSFLGMVLFPFAFAWVVAVCTRPVVHWLCRKLRFSRTLAVLLTLLICLGVLGGLVTLLVLVVVDVVGNVRVYFEDPQNSVMVLVELVQDLYGRLNMDFDQLQDWLARMAEAASQLAGQGFNWAFDVVRATPTAVLLVLVTVVATFYWCRDEEKIKRVLSSLFGARRRHVILESYDSLSNLIGQYLRAQLLLMVVAFCVCTVGFFIIRLPNALPMGLLAGVLDFIPVLGPGTLLVPWATWQLAVGNYALGVGLLVIFLVMTIVRNLLQPKILGDQMGLHPLVVLASIFVGMRMFGVVGLIIGPVFVAIFMALYRDRKARRLPPRNPDQA